MADSVTIKPLSRPLLEPAFDLTTEVFARDSTLHQALGIALCEYRDHLRAPFEAMIDEGLSLVAVDADGTVLGTMIATDFHASGNPTTPHLQRLAPLTALTTALCREYLKQNPRKPGEAILIDMGAVALSARGRGLYKALRHKVHQLAKFKGYQLVMGELSSVATQAVVLGQMGHRNVGEIAFDQFTWQGARPFAKVTSPKCLILSEGQL